MPAKIELNANILKSNKWKWNKLFQKWRSSEWYKYVIYNCTLNVTFISKDDIFISKDNPKCIKNVTSKVRKMYIKQKLSKRCCCR